MSEGLSQSGMFSQFGVFCIGAFSILGQSWLSGATDRVTSPGRKHPVSSDDDATLPTLNTAHPRRCQQLRVSRSDLRVLCVLCRLLLSFRYCTIKLLCSTSVNQGYVNTSFFLYINGLRESLDSSCFRRLGTKGS